MRRFSWLNKRLLAGRAYIRCFQLEAHHCLHHPSLLGTHLLLAVGLVLWVYFAAPNGDKRVSLWLTLFFLSLHTGTLWSASNKGAHLYAFAYMRPMTLWYARFALHSLWLLGMSLIVVILYIGWLNYSLRPSQYCGIGLALLNASCIMSFIGNACARTSQNAHKLLPIVALPLLLPIWILCFQLSPEHQPQDLVARLAIAAGFFVLLFSTCSLLFPYIWNK